MSCLVCGSVQAEHFVLSVQFYHAVCVGYLPDDAQCLARGHLFFLCKVYHRLLSYFVVSYKCNVCVFVFITRCGEFLLRSLSCCFSIGLRLFTKRPPFSFQKDAFYRLKGGLLEAKRMPFASVLIISQLQGRKKRPEDCSATPPRNASCKVCGDSLFISGMKDKQSYF